LTVTRLTATAPVVELAEKQIDDTLSSSFPASDPPPWTLGRTETAPPDGPEASDPDDAAGLPTWRRYGQTATSLVGAIGVVLLVPIFVVLLPLALICRVVLDLVRWPGRLPPESRRPRET
jgi:hypothetical protein